MDGKGVGLASWVHDGVWNDRMLTVLALAPMQGLHYIYNYIYIS